MEDASTATFWTIVSGVAVVVLGLIFQKCFIAPVQELRQTIGRVGSTLHFHAPFISNPGMGQKDEIAKATFEIRTLSADLRRSLLVIPWYDQTAWLFRLPPRSGVLEAAGKLIGLSNSLGSSAYRDGTDNMPKAQSILTALRLPIPLSEKIGT